MSREDEIRAWLDSPLHENEASDRVHETDGHLRYLLEKVERLEARNQRLETRFLEALKAWGIDELPAEFRAKESADAS